MPDLMQQVVGEAVLQQAYDWLCKAKKDSDHNNDVWHLRFHWDRDKEQLKQQLLSGEYRFEPCKAIKVNGQSIGVWCAQDALVLKALTLVLTPHMAPNLSDDCYHLAGKGGAKGCVRNIKKTVQDYQYVCRSDVDSYYASIDHKILLDLLAQRISDTRVIALLSQMLTRLDNVNGNLYTVDKGIGKGNPISPLLGALYLYSMDRVLGDYCDKHGLRYYRFMDDWVVLCKTRYQLRHAVKLMNQCLDAVKQTKHPFKTYIGKIKDSGFDFLGYRITPKTKDKVSLAWKTIANHIGKLQQLYEQGAQESRIAEYVKHWLQWVRSGVDIDLDDVLRVIRQSDLGSDFEELGVWG